jgi:hypothetical protein
MCRWLGVGRPSFNEWRTRPLSAAAMRRDELRLIIAKSFDDSDGTYGYRRVHADLAAWGVDCRLELVRKLMRDIGLVPCQPRPWRHCLTESDGQAGPIPDLVERDFTADAPGHKVTLPIYRDLGRMAVFGHRHRLPHQGCHRVGPWVITTRPRLSKPRPTETAITPPPSSPGPEEQQSSPISRSNRDLLRQRDGRIVLRNPQERADPPHRVPHPRTRTTRYCPLHRIALRY